MNQQVILSKSLPNGSLQVLDKFSFTESPAPDPSLLKDEEILVQNKFLGIHASMRLWLSGSETYTAPVQQGNVMQGTSVALVLHSKSKKYAVGELVCGMFRWETYSVAHSDNVYYKVLPNYAHPQHFLSALGNSGLTAWVGLKVIGEVKAGDTVVVSAAAGGVGQFAVGLAKNWGCRVVGIAGTPEKCEYVTKVLGADVCINYKTSKIGEALKAACPKGIDVFFDMVGGETLDEVLLLINEYARIVLCGGITQYQKSLSSVQGPSNYLHLILKQAKMHGYVYFKHKEVIPQAVQEILGLMNRGKITFKECVFDGLEKAPQALQTLFDGKNIGKVIVKVGEPTLKAKL